MDFAVLAQQCAPTVAAQTIAAVVTHESRSNPFAIGINGGARISPPARDPRRGRRNGFEALGDGAVDRSRPGADQQRQPAKARF
jgi:hypothetical protein